MGGQMPENRALILSYIIENNSITRNELSEKVNLATSAVQRHLKHLQEDGYIKRKGKTRASKWIILKEK